MTIEPVIEIFGKYNGAVTMRLREVIFEEFAKTDNYGIIFTFMWAFDMQSDWDYIAHIREIFEPYNAEFYYAELVADKDERFKRNATENRLANKASKRDLDASNKRLVSADAEHRLESYDGEIPYENYIKIDNTALEASEVAQIIKQRFGFE
jgi:hypothetical protein